MTTLLDSKVKVVARLGNYSDLAAALLGPGEMAYLADRKLVAFGDDTPESPEIATSKSTGSIEYMENMTFKFGTIFQFAGATVNGVDLGLLNSATGLLVRGKEDGQFFHRQITNGDTYLSVVNGDGADGNIEIKAAQPLLDLINNAAGSMKFNYGETPPENASPGSAFYSTIDGLLYILIADSDKPTEYWWLDVTSVGSQRRNGGMTMISQDLPPATSADGDVWHDTAEGVYYLRTQDENGPYWVDMRI